MGDGNHDPNHTRTSAEECVKGLPGFIRKRLEPKAGERLDWGAGVDVPWGIQSFTAALPHDWSSGASSLAGLCHGET